MTPALLRSRAGRLNRFESGDVPKIDHHVAFDHHAWLRHFGRHPDDDVAGSDQHQIGMFDEVHGTVGNVEPKRHKGALVQRFEKWVRRHWTESPYWLVPFYQEVSVLGADDLLHFAA